MIQRTQRPNNINVRCLDAIARKLQQSPQKIFYQRVNRAEHPDVHADGGDRRLDGTNEEVAKGCGVRGLHVRRRGTGKAGPAAVRLIELICKAYRPRVRSGRGRACGCSWF